MPRGRVARPFPLSRTGKGAPMDSPLPGAVPERPQAHAEWEGGCASQSALRHGLAHGSIHDDVAMSGDLGPSLEAFRVRAGRNLPVPTSRTFPTASDGVVSRLRNWNHCSQECRSALPCLPWRTSHGTRLVVSASFCAWQDSQPLAHLCFPVIFCAAQALSLHREEKSRVECG